MAEEKSVRKIEIKIQTDGDSALKNLANSVGGLNQSLKSTNGSLGFMKNAFIGMFAALRVQELVGMSDSMQLLGNRMDNLSGGSDKAAGLMQRIGAVANNTKTSIDAMAQIYTRLGAATKDLNLGQTRTLQLAEFLQNTFRLSGASTEEATNSTIQFTQALSLGVLRGQDFKSVMSQNTALSDVLAKGLGKTKGELQKMAEAGKLTNEKVLPVLFKSMGDVNAQAEKMSATFGQTVTVALNGFKLKIFEINKEFDLSGKFATGIKWISENLILLGGIFTSLALIKIPMLIEQLAALAAAGKAFALSNPWTAAFIATATAIGYVGNAYAKTKDQFGDGKLEKLRKDLEYFKSGSIDAQTTAFDLGYKNVGEKVKDIEKQISAIESYKRAMDQSLEKEKMMQREGPLKITGGAEEPLDSKQKLLQRLNKEFDAGKLTVAQYYEQVEKVDKLGAKQQFVEGKKDIIQYHDELRKVVALDLNKKLQQNAISMEQFNKAMDDNKISEMNEKLQAGVITLQEYDAAIIKVNGSLSALNTFTSASVWRKGITDYVSSIGTLAEGVAGAITGAFKGLEDTFVEFTKSGKANFKDFAQAVLDDLNRVIIRSLIIRPLAEGILGAIGPSTSGTMSAGESYSGSSGVMQSANGNIFDGPTLHGYGRGKLGVLGEAGPEAVMPLTRNSKGQLGVSGSSTPVVVNITNNSGGEVTQSESTGPNGEKMIDILIQGKVKEGIASGQFDRVFNQAYGMKRRGS